MAIPQRRIVAGKWSASPLKQRFVIRKGRVVMSIAQGCTNALPSRGIGSLLSAGTPDDPVMLRLHESARRMIGIAEKENGNSSGIVRVVEVHAKDRSPRPARGKGGLAAGPRIGVTGRVEEERAKV